MSVSRRCAALLLSVVAVPSVALGQQDQQQSRQQASETAIPWNVDAGLFASDVRTLLRLSDTFRLQCERIAADRRVRVRLAIATGIDGGGRAQTTFRRYRSGALFADVEVLFGENYRELLAHEFEHVLEQIDGIDLRREAADGRAWEVGAGAYETRRAFLAGVQVLREVETPEPRAGFIAATARALPLRR